MLFIVAFLWYYESEDVLALEAPGGKTLDDIDAIFPILTFTDPQWALSLTHHSGQCQDDCIHPRTARAFAARGVYRRMINLDQLETESLSDGECQCTQGGCQP